MSGEPSAADLVRVSEAPALLQRVAEQVRSADDLDEATRAVGYWPALLNPYFATPADLSPYGLGPATFIPVQISDMPGGRTSILDMQVGDEMLYGIYAMPGGIALRYMKRLSGEGFPARSGDEYSTRLVNRDGVQLVEERGTIVVVDIENGTVEIVIKGVFRCTCYLWTLVCIP
jgi:hypothetical protein